MPKKSIPNTKFQEAVANAIEPEWMRNGRWYAEQQATEKQMTLQGEMDKALVLVTNKWNKRLAKFLS